MVEALNKITRILIVHLLCDQGNVPLRSFQMMFDAGTLAPIFEDGVWQVMGPGAPPAKHWSHRLACEKNHNIFVAKATAQFAKMGETLFQAQDALEPIIRRRSKMTPMNRNLLSGVVATLDTLEPIIRRKSRLQPMDRKLLTVVAVCALALFVDDVRPERRDVES